MGSISFDQFRGYFESLTGEADPSLQKAVKKAQKFIPHPEVEMNSRDALEAMKKVSSCFVRFPKIREHFQRIMREEIEKMEQVEERVLGKKRPTAPSEEAPLKKRKIETVEQMEVEEGEKEPQIEGEERKRKREAGGELPLAKKAKREVEKPSHVYLKAKRKILSHRLKFVEEVAEPPPPKPRARKMDVRQLLTGITARKGKVSARTAHILVSSAKAPASLETGETTKAQWDAWLGTQRKVSQKLLYMVLGDPIGATSEDLQGYNQLEGWAEFSRLIDSGSKAFDCTEEFTSYKNQLDNGSEIGEALLEDTKTASSKLRARIANLKVGESIIFPGGWSEHSGGHALVYEYKKGKGENDNQFIIYNTGAGVQYHPGELNETKRTVAPLVITGVKPDDVCSPLFVGGLKTLCFPREDKPWSEKEIYNQLVPILKGRVADPQEAPDIETQLSGICTWASLFAYAYKKMSPESFGKYEKVRLAIGLKVLHDFVNDKAHETLSDLILAEKCQQSLSQFLIEAFAPGAISQDEFTYIQEKISSISTTIKNQRHLTDEQRSNLGLVSVSRKANELTIYQKESSFPSLQNEIPSAKQVEKFSPQLATMMPHFELTTIDDCLTKMAEVTGWCRNQIKSKNFIECQYAIDTFSTKLVNFLTEHDISALSKTNRRLLIVFLQMLGKMYLENYLQIMWHSGKPVRLLSQIVATYVHLILSAKILGNDMQEIREFPLCDSHENLLFLRILKGFYCENFQTEKYCARSIEEWDKEFSSLIFHPEDSDTPQVFNAGVSGINAELPLDKVFEKGTREQFSLFLEKLFHDSNIPLERGDIPPKIWEQMPNDQAKAVLLCADKYEEGEREGTSSVQYPFRQNLSNFRQLVDFFQLICSSELRYIKPQRDLAISTNLVVKMGGPPPRSISISSKIPGALGEYEFFLYDVDPFSVVRKSYPVDSDRVMHSHDAVLGGKRDKEAIFIYSIMPTNRTNTPEKLLFLIRTKKLLQIDTALATFSSYTSLLSKPWWRYFLEEVLFAHVPFELATSNTLLKTTTLHLADFLRQEMQRSLLSDNMDRALFALRLSRMLLERDEHQSLSREEVNGWFNLLSKRIYEAKEDPHFGQYQHLWHYEFARFLSLDPSAPLEQLITSAAIAAQTCSQERPQMWYEISCFLREILDKPESRDLLAKNPSPIINAILGESRTWTQLEYPVFESFPLRFELHTGLLTHDNATYVPTPSALTSHPLLKQITQGNLPKEVIEQKQGVYLFDTEVDSRNFSFRVFIEREAVTIQKKIGTSWYECVPESVLFPPNAEQGKLPRGLIEGNLVWRHETLPILRIEHNGKAAYEVDFQGDTKIYVCDEKEKRTQAQVLPASSLPEYFASVEQDEYILPISSDGTSISRILFTRAGKEGLSFSYDTKNKTFRRDGAPDEILLPNQYVPALEGISHKLVLRNEKTHETYVLLFGHELETKKAQSAVSTDFKLKGPHQNLSIYTLKKEKKSVTPCSPEARTYLAYTLLWGQQYEKSFQFLDQLERTPLSEDAMQVLKLIVTASPHDNDVRSHAVRLKAAAALERQKMLYTTEVQIPYYGSALTSFNNARHLAGMLFLTEEEEELLGAPLLPHEEMKRLPIPRKQPAIKMDDTYSSRGFLGFESYEDSSILLRPHFKETFWKFAKLILSNQESALLSILVEISFGNVKCTNKEELTRLLEIAAGGKASRDQTAAAILLAMCRHPEKFTDVSLGDIDAENDANWKTLFERASPLFKEEKAAPAEEKKIPFPVPEKKAEPSYAQLPPPLDIVDPGKTDFATLSGKLFTEWSQQRASLAKTEHVATLVPGTSPLRNTALADFTQAVKAYQEQGTKMTLSFNSEELEGVKAQLIQQRDITKSHTKELRHQLVAFLYKRREDRVEMTALQNAMEEAGFTQPSMIQDAIFALLKPFPDGFFDLNPALSLDDALAMRKLTIEYLENKTYLSHLDDTLSALDRIQRGDTSQQALQQLRGLLITQRHYDAALSPHFLVFEEAFGHILRKEQVQSLLNFMSGKYSGEVMEMIMGSGKSSVLLPILGFLVALAGKLPIFVIPENLYPSMSPEMARICQKSFSQLSFSWETKPNETISIEKLRFIEKGIKRTFDEKGILICTPREISGLVLDFLSTLSRPASKETDEKIALYQSIFTQFIAHGRAVFDEVDSTWDVLKEHLLATAELRPIDPVVLDISCQLYQFLAVMPVESKKKNEFLEKESPILVDKIVESLTKTADPKIQEEVKNNIPLIKEYLSGNRSEKEIEQLVASRGVLAVCCKEIRQIIPETFTRVLGVHYGEAGEKDAPYAVKYEAGMPLPNSRFGHDLEEVCCTFQMYMGASSEKLEAVIQEWVSSIKLKVSDELLNNPSCDVMKFSEIVWIRSFLGDEIARSICTESKFEATKKIVGSFKGSPENKVRFIREVYLRKLNRPTSYQRTSSLIYSLLFEVFGVSGTVWNKDTYPLCVHTSPQAESVGKTASILLEDVAPSREFDDLETLLQPNEGVIDIAGKLVDYQGQAIAQKILAKSDPQEIKGVIFYNAQKQKCVLERNKAPYPLQECTLPKDKLTAYWAKPFTTGADLQVRQDAKCVVIIGKDTIFRDVAQGCWRLRGLDKGQTCQLAVDRETAKIIRKTLQIKDEPLTNEHIIAFTICNQIELQGVNNYRAFKNDAEGFLQQGAFQAFLSKDVREAYQECKDLFSFEKQQDLFQLYGAQVHEQPTADALSQFNERLESSGPAAYLIHKGYVSDFHQKLNDLAASMQEVLPAQVQEVPQDTSTAVQIQVSTQTQTQVQLQASSETSDHSDWRHGKELNFKEYLELLGKGENFKEAAPPYDEKIVKQAPVTSIKNMFEMKPEGAKFAPFFSAHFFTSMNLFPCYLDKYSPFTKYSAPGAYMLCVRDRTDGSLRTILLSQQDATDFLESSFLKEKNRYEMVLANIHSGTLYSHESSKELEGKLEKDPNFLITRVQAKVLMGNTSLTRTEQLAFIAWCLSLGEDGFSKVWEFYEKYLTVARPESIGTQAIIGGIVTDRGVSLITDLLKQLLTSLESEDPRRKTLEQHALTLQGTKKVTPEMIEDIMRLNA